MMYSTGQSHSLPPKPVFNHPPSQSPQGISTIDPGGPSPHPPHSPHDAIYSSQYAFCIQLSTNPGPAKQDILYATPNAETNWLHPPGCPPEKQVARTLPFYQNIVHDLEIACREIHERNDGCNASVKVTDVENTWIEKEKNPGFENQRPKRDISIGVWLGGPDHVSIVQMRNLILSRTPVQLRTAAVDLDHDHYWTEEEDIRSQVHQHLAKIAAYCGVDIFLCRPEESRAAGDPEVDASQNKRLRIKIYGDYESVEHAKTRVLLMIDDMMGLKIVPMYLELSMHSLLCGRNRKNLRMVEQRTSTAIYFPPPFPRVYGYTPKGAQRRHPDEIFITGKTREEVAKAELALNVLVRSIKFGRAGHTPDAYRDPQSLSSHCFVKDVQLGFRKIDFLIMDRLDELRSIMEQNGTFIQFPPLASGTLYLRVQGVETLHIERTVRAVMTLASQYYDATWWIMANDQAALHNLRIPTTADFRQVLVDISARSGTDLAFTKNFFEICGSDWAVRKCLELLHDFDYARCGSYQTRIKIELANEHKEFVAGKKNGKINKIMGQSGIHILFEAFNEYNFYIDVVGNKFSGVMHGLELVEQELPASMSFHVPDTYHKRIIGVGGQHIQTIMKKYSVFVKFSNAMERGTAGKIENEDLKVDNVICRTPARNAANLELVKADIMEMVQQVDADITTETVEIPRLHHRDLNAKRPLLDDLERQWGCTVSFPSTELASDVVTVKGPEWQIPHFKEGLLALVPESHKIRLKWSPQLDQALQDDSLQNDVAEPMKERLCIEMKVLEPTPKDSEQERTIEFSYTRNDAGGLQDAIELLLNHLLSRKITAQIVEGRLSRPKSDSFEDFSPFFESAVLQKSSQDPLNRPGSRNSGEFQGNGSPSDSRAVSATEQAFYNGDNKRRPSVPDTTMNMGMHGPGSIGSGSNMPMTNGPGSTGSASSRASYHSRAASLDSDWERISAHSRT